MTRIAIIGAGLSGLVVARRLSELADVTVYEKSRGPGGRMATRYAGAYEFDHGAQFFTARTAAFRAFLQPLVDDDVIANWTAQFVELDGGKVRTLRAWSDEHPHYVGRPGMNAVGKFLSRGLRIVTETRITGIERSRGGWTLTDSASETFDGYDWVVLTAPAGQTAELGSSFPGLVELCNEREMQACFALMLGFAQQLELRWQAALVRNADVSWISVNSSKPGRAKPFTMLVHSTNAWADAHVNDELESVGEHMLWEASRACGEDLRRAEHRQVHRWRYANIARQSGPQFYVDDDAQLAACGDWFVRGRIEAAFTSASALGEVIVKRLR